MRGGSFDGYSTQLASSYRSVSTATSENFDNGFRVASVPEPTSLALLLAGVVALISYAWRRRWSRLVTGCAAMVLISAVGTAQADVFNMGSTISGGTWTGLASLSFVTVGNPGNASDPATGGTLRSVGYTYQMGKYDVTLGQYTTFLNDVAKTDTFGLYNSYMGQTMPPKAFARTAVRAVSATRSQARTRRQPTVRCSTFPGAMPPDFATGCKTASRPVAPRAAARPRRGPTP